MNTAAPRFHLSGVHPAADTEPGRFLCVVFEGPARRAVARFYGDTEAEARGRAERFAKADGPSVPLSEVARIIRETAPVVPDANRLQDKAWGSGCDCARERIANAIADLADMRPSERAEFCAAAGVSDLKG